MLQGRAAVQQVCEVDGLPEPRDALARRDVVRRLLDSLSSDDWVGLRDRLIVNVLFLCGVRLGECARLRAADAGVESARFELSTLDNLLGVAAATVALYGERYRPRGDGPGPAQMRSTS